MITITTINNSWYFIDDFTIKPNQAASYDENQLNYKQVRDLLNAEATNRVSINSTDKVILQNLLETLDGSISESELKTLNGISLVGSGDITISGSGQDQALSDLQSACHVEGGDLVLQGGNSFILDGGIGYARNPSGVLTRVTWQQSAVLQTIYNGANYIGVDYNAQIVFSDNVLGPDFIPCAYIFTTNNNTTVLGSANVRLTGKDSLYRLGDLFRNTIGTLVESGISTAMKPEPNQLELVVSQGKLWYLLNKYEVTETDSFIKLYQNATGFSFDFTNPNQINLDVYADTNLAGNSLVPLSAGYYKKDMIAVTPSNRVYYLYGVGEYSSYDEILEAPVPDVPESIKNSVLRSAALIVKQGEDSVHKVLDIRPMFTKLFNTGAAASNATVISHTDLVDLAEDSHFQYHTDIRGDFRYYRKSEVDTFVNSKADSNHTHDNATTSDSGFMSNLDKTKLDGIANSATANQSDSFLRNRTNHTGTQPSSTISDFNTVVDTRIGLKIQNQINDGIIDIAPSQNAVFDSLATKSNVGHTHIISDVANLQTTLDQKASLTHPHQTTDIVNFDSAVRTLAVSDEIINGVTNKAPSQNSVFDALATKADLNHSHTVAQITDFDISVDTRVNNRLATVNLEDIADVNTISKSNGQVLSYNNSTNTWVAVTPASGNMTKSTYDTTDNGIVDNSERLGNNLPNFYTNRINHTGTQDVSSITGLTKASVGLPNADNTADIDKVISNATQTALNGKENTIPLGTISDYYAGNKTMRPLVTDNVVESTNKRFISDAQKTVVQNTSGTNTGDETTTTIKSKLGVASTTTEGYLTSAAFNTFNNKEPAIPTGTTSQYVSGNKTLQILNATAVGLNNLVNVDNTNATNITTGTLSTARLSTTLQKLDVLSDSPSTDTIVGSNADGTYSNKLLTSLDSSVTITSTSSSINLSVADTGASSDQFNSPGSKTFRLYEEFVSQSATQVSPYFARTVSGGSTTILAPRTISPDPRLGVIGLNTGATSNNYATLTLPTNSINFGSLPTDGYIEFSCSFAIQAISAVATGDYIFRCGFGDSATSTLPVDCVLFTYTTNSLRWLIRSNNTILLDEAIVGLVALVVNTDYTVRIRVTKTATGYSTSLKLNNIEAITTIAPPNGTSRDTGVQITAVKGANVAASRIVELDWAYLEHYNPSKPAY